MLWPSIVRAECAAAGIAPQAPVIPSGYLHAAGSKIVDADGHPVRIVAIGWNGMNVTEGRFDGLEGPFRGYEANLAHMRLAGFNTVRVQEVNPDALIIIEDVINFSDTFAGRGIAPEGDLTAGRHQPVILRIPNKVVYSVHEYPNEISGFPIDSGPRHMAFDRIQGSAPLAGVPSAHVFHLKAAPIGHKPGEAERSAVVLAVVPVQI